MLSFQMDHGQTFVQDFSQETPDFGFRVKSKNRLTRPIIDSQRRVPTFGDVDNQSGLNLKESKLYLQRSIVLEPKADSSPNLPADNRPQKTIKEEINIQNITKLPRLQVGNLPPRIQNVEMSKNKEAALCNSSLCEASTLKNKQLSKKLDLNIWEIFGKKTPKKHVKPFDASFKEKMKSSILKQALKHDFEACPHDSLQISSSFHDNKETEGSLSRIYYKEIDSEISGNKRIGSQINLYNALKLRGLSADQNRNHSELRFSRNFILNN